MPDIHSKGFSHFTSQMSELIKGPVQSIHKDASIGEAALKMSIMDVGSLIIIQEENPIGIVTRTDLVKRVLAVNMNAGLSIAQVMTPHLITIEYNRPIFEGLMLMLSHNITHLLVMDGEKMAGVVSERDWLSFQEHHPINLFRAIEEAKTVKAVAALRREGLKLVQQIFEEEGDAESLTQLITEINDRVTETVIESALAEMKVEGHGEPPVAFAWIAMGSEGRRAQTSSTDQDNGLVFENVPEDQFSKVQKWFLQFAEKVVAGLEICGFPRCKGNTMATNPELCLSVEIWHRLFTTIIANSDHEALLKASIYFDFRALYGQEALVEELWNSLLQRIQHNRNFLRFLTENVLLAGRPPVNNWNWRLRSMLELSPPPIDIKRSALSPLVMTVRVLALACGTSVTHTLDRLRVIEEKGLMSSELAEAIKEAYDFIMLLRIRRDFASEENGTLNDNIIHARDLNPLQRRFLKGSLRTIYELQDFLYEKFGGGIFN